MAPKKAKILTSDFFHKLINGRLTSADKALNKIKLEISTSEWQRGYLNALEGMLSASGSRKDEFVFINQIGTKDVGKLTKIFSRRSKNKMQSNFDRGFFVAWVDYTKSLKDSPKTSLSF